MPHKPSRASPPPPLLRVVCGVVCVYGRYACINMCRYIYIYLYTYIYIHTHIHVHLLIEKYTHRYIDRFIRAHPLSMGRGACWHEAFNAPHSLAATITLHGDAEGCFKPQPFEPIAAGGSNKWKPLISMFCHYGQADLLPAGQEVYYSLSILKR